VQLTYFPSAGAEKGISERKYKSKMEIKKEIENMNDSLTLSGKNQLPIMVAVKKVIKVIKRVSKRKLVITLIWEVKVLCNDTFEGLFMSLDGVPFELEDSFSMISIGNLGNSLFITFIITSRI
jgi:hypothetical protein